LQRVPGARPAGFEPATSRSGGVERNGNYTTLTDPNVAGTTTPGDGTEPSVVTNEGTIIGTSINGGVANPYVDQGGNYTTLLPPPTGLGFVNTYAVDTPPDC
jgi:hypothetical protein